MGAIYERYEGSVNRPQPRALIAGLPEGATRWRGKGKWTPPSGSPVQTPWERIGNPPAPFEQPVPADLSDCAFEENKNKINGT